MAKIDNKTQWSQFGETHIFKCYCGSNSYIQVIQDPEDRELYFSITQHPTRLKERLGTAWKALRGLEFTASDEVILLDTDARKLIKALTLPPKPIKKETK